MISRSVSRRRRPNGRRRSPERALAVVLLLTGVASGCSPIYVLKAGLAEARILAARRPIPEVLQDPGVDARTMGKLRLILDARAFAADSLGLDVGDAYSTYTRLESDTLAMILSGAHRDRLVPVTWWFPIVGRVPYKGYFELDDAQRAQRALEEEGFDTYLRPTAAFSTLGWFSDPVLSTFLYQDEVDLVETILHELSHRELFVPGHVQFNESFASFVGRVGAAHFFCTREGGGPDTVWCQRAQARWRDDMRYSRFLDEVVEGLQGLYGRSDLTLEETLAQREEMFGEARRRFAEEVQPTFESSTFSGFLSRPLNNATLLAQMVYYHRLPDFQAFLEGHGGDLRAAIDALEERARNVDDPFGLLPTASE